MSATNIRYALNPANNRDLQHSFPIDEPRTIDVGSIESELTSLWKQATGEESENPSVIRACSLNLVVWTDDERESQAMDRLLADITVSHPSRIFLVTAQHDAMSPAIEAWVSARCSLPLPGEKQVCCEQINLAVGGRDIGKAPSIITSLVVPDVPTVLFWRRGFEQEDPVFHPLARLANHVVIDSSDSVDPNQHFQRLSRIVDGSMPGTSFSDLSWAALAAWRVLLADCAEPNAARNIVRNLSELTIVSGNGGAASAILLLAWIANALGLNGAGSAPKGTGGACRFELNKNGMIVTANIFETDAGTGVPESIASVTLKSHRFGSITIEPNGVKACATVARHGVGGDVEEQVVPTGSRALEDLLAHELEVLESDETYLKAVWTAAQMGVEKKGT